MNPVPDMSKVREAVQKYGKPALNAPKPKQKPVVQDAARRKVMKSQAWTCKAGFNNPDFHNA